MELVNLMYRYVNRFINSNELINELKKIDISNYSEKDKKVIDKLIKDIEEVRDKTPNEIDEVEKKRLEQIDYLLDKFKEVNTSDEQAKEFIEKQYNNLLEDKEKIKDGGKLYTKITDLLTNNSVINKSASKMNDKELLTFITRYISVPLPPPIKQEDFNDLVKVGIKEDNREALWRLAVNYDKKMDFTLIEDYFIDKRDSYYLIELVSATDSVNLDNIVSKVVATNDRKFMIDLANRSLELSIFTEEEKEELKETKKIIYSTSLVNPTKAKIIGDMDNVPYEYYNTALELINNFINGQSANGEVKHLKKDGNSVGFMELRSDQVRIVFKHIKDNIYNIIGAFAKKTNNDTTMYQTMFSRMLPDISTEEKLSKQLEIGELTNKQLNELLLTKGRKGTR